MLVMNIYMKFIRQVFACRCLLLYGRYTGIMWMCVIPYIEKTYHPITDILQIPTIARISLLGKNNFEAGSFLIGVPFFGSEAVTKITNIHLKREVISMMLMWNK